MDFGKMPVPEYAKSKFKLKPYTISDTMNHGLLYPVDAIPVVPGETISINLSALWRQSTPIVPYFGLNKMYYTAFFVPYAQLWDNWNAFLLANNDDQTGSNDDFEMTIPHCTYLATETLSDKPLAFASRLGKPLQKTNTPLSIMKERAYLRIWNDYFRPASLVNPLMLDRSDGPGDKSDYGLGFYNYSIADNNDEIKITDNCLPVAKELDVFTSALLTPQHGPGVTLPLGDYANVMSAKSLHDMEGNIMLSGTGTVFDSGLNLYPLYVKSANGNSSSGAPVPLKIVFDNNSDSVVGSSVDLNKSNLVADLSNATASSILSLRLAVQTQLLQERLLYAWRGETDLDLVIYGVHAESLVLQRPDYIGKIVKAINVQDIYSTAGYAEDNATVLGEVGAFSATGIKNENLVRYTPLQQGLIMILCFSRFEQQYSQGYLKEDRRLNFLDGLIPMLAHVGDEVIEVGELFAMSFQGGAEKHVFGYNERFYDYKNRFSRANGLTNPLMANSMPYWTLANNFENAPALNRDFIFEDRTPLVRALKTGANGPDYISYTLISITRIAPFPIYSIPGLMDHTFTV